MIVFGNFLRKYLISIYEKNLVATSALKSDNLKVFIKSDIIDWKYPSESLKKIKNKLLYKVKYGIAIECCVEIKAKLAKQFAKIQSNWKLIARIHVYTISEIFFLLIGLLPKSNKM